MAAWVVLQGGGSSCQQREENCRSPLFFELVLLLAPHLRPNLVLNCLWIRLNSLGHSPTLNSVSMRLFGVAIFACCYDARGDRKLFYQCAPREIGPPQRSSRRSFSRPLYSLNRGIKTSLVTWDGTNSRS
jgi:hypothetical protein